MSPPDSRQRTAGSAAAVIFFIRSQPQPRQGKCSRPQVHLQEA